MDPNFVSDKTNIAEKQRVEENRAAFKLSLYILGVVLISMILLATNAGLVFGLLRGVALSTWFSDSPILDPLQQLFIYVCPVILLYLEWYAWDVISSRRLKRADIQG